MFESTYSSAFKGTINIGGGGSTAGIQDLHNGQVGIGDSDVSEYLAGTNYGLKDHIVATVGVAVVVSNDVYNTYGIKQLPQSIIKGIFNGTITDWGDSAVTPYESTKAAAGTNINVFYRSPGSGTRILFENYCMNQGSGFTYPNDTHHHQESSSSLIAANVGGSNTNAIGYETLPYVQGLNAISIKFDLNSGTSYVAPNYTNIDNGIYPMWGYEHLFTVGTPNATLQAFIDYVTSPTSQTTILNNHYGLYTNLGGTALANVGHR
jgi:phosphate transport system substrate-binding protein